MDKEPPFNPESIFYLDDWQVDPATSRIRLHRKVIKLEPRVMSVLVCLAAHSGQLVTREQLERAVWGDTIVTYDSLAAAIIKLRKAFDDDSRNPRFIETLPKKGYRLLIKATTTPQKPATTATLPAFLPRFLSGMPLSVISMAFIVILLLAIILGITFNGSPGTSGSKPTIAVLPFQNLSNDQAQEYFSDGISADLITDLSKLSGISVIARNTSFIYKNSNVDLKSIGDELKVNYVIEGSVRKLDKQVRISARLVDTANNHSLWADRFDGGIDNLFEFQDQVTSAIISALELKLSGEEHRQLGQKYSNSIAAYDEFLRGWQHLWLGSRDGVTRAITYFEKSIELDPYFARAHANLALSYLYDYMHGWSENSEQSLQKASDFASRGIALNNKIPQVHWVKGYVDVYRREYQSALAEAELAISMAPNFADGYGLLATVLNFSGQPQRAAQEMEKAMRLNPRHPSIYKLMYGEMLFNLNDYDGAISHFQQVLLINPENEEARLWLVAALAHTGQIDDAQWELDMLRMAHHPLSLERIRRISPFRKIEQRDHLINGLRMAGLQE